MSVAIVKKQVREFARYHGLTISPKPGSEPLIGNDKWYRVFDSWDEARGFFRAVYEQKRDRDIAYPWESK